MAVESLVAGPRLGSRLVAFADSPLEPVGVVVCFRQTDLTLKEGDSKDAGSG